jgi:hypothetical protein
LALDKKELPVLEPGAMCYMMSKHQYLFKRSRHELASASDVFLSGRRGEKLGSQSAGLAGSGDRRSGRTGDYYDGPGWHMVDGTLAPPMAH